MDKRVEERVRLTFTMRNTITKNLAKLSHTLSL